MLTLSALPLFACGDDKEMAHDHPHPPPRQSESAPADHGAKTDLGTVTIAGRSFGVSRLGAVIPGKEAAFEVHPKGLSAEELAGVNLYLWVEDALGSQRSAPAKGSREGTALHFHVSPTKSQL